MFFLNRLFSSNDKNKFDNFSNFDGSIIQAIDKTEKVIDKYFSFDQLISFSKIKEPPKSINKNIFLQDVSNFLKLKKDVLVNNSNNLFLQEISDLYKDKEFIDLNHFEGEFQEHLNQKDFYGYCLESPAYDFSDLIYSFTQIAHNKDSFIYYINVKCILRIVRNEFKTIDKKQLKISKSIPLRFIIHKYFDLVFTFKDKINNGIQNLNIIINHLIVEHNAKKIFIRVNAFSQ